METILLADAHEIIRQGIRSIIKRISRKYKLIEANSCADIRQILSRQRVHYAIADVVLADGNMLFTAQDILKYSHQTKILVYTASSEKLYARRLLEKGVKGYLCKDTSVEELENAIRILLRNEIYLSPYLKETIFKFPKADKENPIDTLSDRELAVVESLMLGTLPTEIAKRMDLNITTISTYRRRAFRKLNVQSIIELKDQFLFYKNVHLTGNSFECDPQRQS